LNNDSFLHIKNYAGFSQFKKFPTDEKPPTDKISWQFLSVGDKSFLNFFQVLGASI